MTRIVYTLTIMLLLAMPSANAGELTEPIAATELKVTPRGTGEDLQHALERARSQLPENALAVGVECVPEPDGLINCSYLYRLQKGAQIAPVSCRDFSPYRMCIYGNVCYGEGTVLTQENIKKACQRDAGNSWSNERDEYRRLVWTPVSEK